MLLLLVMEAHVDAFQSSVSDGTLGTRNKGFRRSNNRGIVKNRYLWERHYPEGRSRTSIQMDRWDGDDIRWTSRIRRKLSRRRMVLDTSTRSQVKNYLIALQVVMYCYQILTTVVYCRRKFPSYWPNHAMEIIIDSIWGSAFVSGPLTTTFGFSAAFSRAQQSYRYITSGLFHNSLTHLLIDIGVMGRQPIWLASGLGAPLYLTCFFGSIVIGNLGHLMNSTDRLFDPKIYLGSNGGICGLFGLMFVCLARMASANSSRNSGPSTDQLAGMVIMLFLAIWMDNVSMASNIGGFFGGIIIGVLCGPRYTKDYAMRRKNSVEFDRASNAYRSAMGFGIMPTDSGLIPLKLLYSIVLTIAIAVPKYRSIPVAIIRGCMGVM